MANQDDATRVRWLLHELCTRLGFCDALRDPGTFERLVPAGIDAFTDAVLVAEGLDPCRDRDLRRMVREVVARRFEAWGRA